MSKKQTLK